MPKFEVGEYITIVERTDGIRDFIWQGEPLRVLAVQEPFVVVETPMGFRKPLNVNRVNLMPLSDEYVAAMQGVEIDGDIPDAFTRAFDEEQADDNNE